MAILPISIARVSDQLRTSVALSSITKTQSDLLQVQNQISTGKRVNTPSDDPGAATLIQQLQKTLDQRTAYATNLQSATSQLGEVDSSLSDLTDVLQQAQTIASQNVGSDVTATQRQAAGAVVDSLIGQALAIGNKQFNGVYIFAGDRATSPPFVDSNGTIKYVGSSTVLRNHFDEGAALPFMVDGEKVFGALTTQVTGTANLTPALGTGTRLIDLAGANGNGISLGLIRLGDGTSNANVDLSQASNLGDVVAAINAAGLTGLTASIGTTGIQLTGTGNISVNEIGGGSTASDLGILAPTGAGAGAAVNGQAMTPQVTPLTQLSDLNGGAGIDPSGITITNGGLATHLDFSGVTTVEGMLNKINGSKAGVLARINAAGTGIDIVNPTQGTSLTIGENGGQTAAQLGVRSMTAATKLSDLNGGQGVRTVAGPDFQITRADGTSFSVDADGLHSVQDVIDAINTADGGTGVTASFGQNSNGIVLTDSTGGGGALSVSALNASSAAKDLGLLNPASGNTITGADVNPVNSTSIFADLASLRNALQTSDQLGITRAAAGLQQDHDQVVLMRGQAGARVKGLQSRQTQLDDENLATKSLLSNVQDTDLATAITKFQNLQTALQAGYKMTAEVSHLSLLDFLA
jgi:flagellar hook-associated protein 3 FlgL